MTLPSHPSIKTLKKHREMLIRRRKFLETRIGQQGGGDFDRAESAALNIAVQLYNVEIEERKKKA